MEWQKLAAALFPLGHQITEQDDFLSGSAQVGAETVAIIGTTGHAPIGVEIALAQAQAILQTVRQFPGRAIVLLVDTQGSDDIALRTFDFSAHRPDVVQFRHSHLSTQASGDLGDWLTGLGYELVFDRQDVLGLNRSRFDPRLVRFCQDLMFAARAN